LEIKMPQLGESVTEGTIGKWLVRPGDRVQKYQPIAEVITDKVNAEIPAPADGEVGELLIAEGATVKVGTLIARLVGAGGGTEDGPAAAPAPAAEVAGSASAEQAREGGRYSPVVMRLAQDSGVDLSRVAGTGLGGRISRKDVAGYIAAGGVAAQVLIPAAEAPPMAPAPAPAPLADDQVIPVDAVRRRIAEKMRQSKHEAPHAWTMMPVDVTGLVKLKEQQGAEFKRREGVSLSFVPFFIKAVVESLREYPIINSQWAGDTIIIKKDLNISIAVATETSLSVPVIKHADRLSITGLNHAVADLAARARAGKLSVEDISGGTFTVNNTGYFGSYISAPIINHPQAAILSFEAITKTPVVVEGDAIAIRSIMHMCMSLDHRVLDGLVCGKFLQAVKQRLQSYAPGSVALS